MPPRYALAVEADAPPVARAYWVVPGLLLAGAYPSAPEPSQRRERIAAIWAAGIRTFVSLVEEREKAHGTPFAQYVEILDQLTASTGARAACIRCGVPDGGLPSVGGMRSVLDTIDLSLDAGRPVYVHCFGGMGRTATVVGCWLLRHELASTEDVLDVITALRRADVQRRDWPAPESAQRPFVKAWPRGR